MTATKFLCIFTQSFLISPVRSQTVLERHFFNSCSIQSSFRVYSKSSIEVCFHIMIAWHTITSGTGKFLSTLASNPLFVFLSDSLSRVIRSLTPSLNQMVSSSVSLLELKLLDISSSIARTIPTPVSDPVLPWRPLRRWLNSFLSISVKFAYWCEPHDLLTW